MDPDAIRILPMIVSCLAVARLPMPGEWLEEKLNIALTVSAAWRKDGRVKYVRGVPKALARRLNETMSGPVVWRFCRTAEPDEKTQPYQIKPGFSPGLIGETEKGVVFFRGILSPDERRYILDRLGVSTPPVHDDAWVLSQVIVDLAPTLVQEFLDVVGGKAVVLTPKELFLGGYFQPHEWGAETCY